MYQRITVDGADLYVAASVSGVVPEIAVERCPGLFSLPPVKDLTAPLPDADGVIDLTTWYEARGISPQGWIKGNGFPAFYAAVDRLKSMLKLGADHSVAWTFEDGSIRRAICRCISLEVEEGDVAPFATWAASLRAADPIMYGGSLKSATFDPFAAGLVAGVSWPVEWPLPFVSGGAGTGPISMINSGTARALPIYTITGPWTNPWVENLTTGRILYTRGVILGAADVLTIDMRKPELERVTLNGVSRLGWVDFSRSEWPILASGANLLRAGGAFTSGAGMLVQAEDAYL